MKVKICKRCKLELSINNFWKNSNVKDGYFNKCKSCANKVGKENALKLQKYVTNNLWTCQGCNKELELNKDNFYKRNDNNTGFQHRCKVCVKKDPTRTKRLIKKDDLNLFIIDRFHGARNRALKKTLDFDLTIDFLLELWNKQNGKCVITNLQMTHTILEGKIKTNLSIDKINPNLGYTKNNVQLVCNIVNVMKSDMDIEQLKYLCNLIIQNHD